MKAVESTSSCPSAPIPNGPQGPGSRVRPSEARHAAGGGPLLGGLPPRLHVEAGEHALAFAEAGSGRDVVLLHGVLTSLDDMMVGLGESLSRNYRVVAFDRPGHGGTTRPAFDGSLLTQAAIVVDGMKALGLHDPIIVGHSNGGSLALTLATHFPDEIGGVVALAPLVFAEPRLEMALFGSRGIPGVGYATARSGLRPMDAAALPILWNAMFAPQRMPEHFADAMPFRTLSDAGEMVRTGEDSIAIGLDLLRNVMLYPACGVPIRILGGSLDIVVNNAMHGRLLATIMPDCTFERVEGVGHMLQHFISDRIADVVEALSADLAPRNPRRANVLPPR